MKLIGELRKEKEEEFRQHCYRNSSVQIPTRIVSYVLKKSNCSNATAEIGKKRKFFFGNCGNGIAENGNKLNGIMAMSLPKMGGKKKFVAKIWEEILKKMLRSQYFYNTFTTNHR